MDELDRRIVHALHVAPRAPWRRIGGVLGVSDQTVARRYQALKAEAGLRVVGCIAGRRLGWVDWALRIQCTPDAADAVAGALASRDDTRWVRLVSGGTEVQTVVAASPAEQQQSVLLRRLAGSRRILGISAHSVLHQFKLEPGWHEVTMYLSDSEAAELAEGVGLAAVWRELDELAELSDTDRALLAGLARDGRATHAELAVLTGWHESTVRRRIEALHQGGILYYDVDIDDACYGQHVQASLFMTVAPGRLAAVGAAIACHPEVPFVAATSGRTNLMASVLCPDVEHLYQYISKRIGTLEGAGEVEATPIMATIKREGLTRGYVAAVASRA
jgi:DNA-binding Lrp family transcriptional regulator